MSASNSHRQPLPYSITVKRRGEGFRLGIPELELECDAADLGQGYQRLETAAQELMARLRERGAADDIPPSQPPPDEGTPSATAAGPAERADEAGETTLGLPGLLRIVAMLVLLASLPGLFAAWSALNEVAGIARDIRALTSPVAMLGADPEQAARQFSTTLRRVADTVALVTPEREEQMRRDVRIIVEKLMPLADELRPLFTGEPAAEPPAPNNDSDSSSATKG